MNDWRDQARCRNLEPELFFPVGHITDADKDQIKTAKSVCRGCRVRLDCLEWALTIVRPPITDGIWGGLTETERRVLRRRRQLAGVR